MTTLTRAEAGRLREGAWDRYGDAKEERDSWANVLAEHAAKGHEVVQDSIAAFIVDRAAAFEARADWEEALERYDGLVSA